MTRVLLDTNIVISALLFPESVPAQVLACTLDRHDLVLTQWVLDELDRVVADKRPDLLPALNDLFDGIEFELAVPSKGGPIISDPNDQPILDAATAARVDILVTGDKRFHALGLEMPEILTARGFLERFEDLR